MEEDQDQRQFFKDLGATAEQAVEGGFLWSGCVLYTVEADIEQCISRSDNSQCQHYFS
jgi:hypothetical protein